MTSYEQLKLEADEWLAGHSSDRSKQSDHGPCESCGQNMQLLNGVPIPHHRRRLNGAAPELCSGGSQC